MLIIGLYFEDAEFQLNSLLLNMKLPLFGHSVKILKTITVSLSALPTSACFPALKAAYRKTAEIAVCSKRGAWGWLFWSGAWECNDIFVGKIKNYLFDFLFIISSWCNKKKNSECLQNVFAYPWCEVSCVLTTFLTLFRLGASKSDRFVSSRFNISIIRDSSLTFYFWFFLMVSVAVAASAKSVPIRAWPQKLRLLGHSGPRTAPEWDRIFHFPDAEAARFDKTIMKNHDQSRL